MFDTSSVKKKQAVKKQRQLLYLLNDIDNATAIVI